MITIDYALKVLAREKMKDRFKHKVKYGRRLENKWGYDKQGHREEYLRLKDKPFDPRTWY